MVLNVADGGLSMRSVSVSVGREVKRVRFKNFYKFSGANWSKVGSDHSHAMHQQSFEQFWDGSA
jgi:hypothetical protein